MQTLTVKKITQGSVIGVFSPSEPIIEKRKAGFDEGLAILQSNGFKVKIAKNVFGKIGFAAGSIEDRVSDIRELLDLPEVGALMSSWGGKSCNQIVNLIDYDLVKLKRKAFMGFSDAGVLLNHITAKTGLVTFYGPNVVGKLNETEHTDMKILKGGRYKDNLLGNVAKVNCVAVLGGVVEGKLIGGNLSTFVLGVVCSQIPDSYYEGKILFWEDTSNPPQIINQYLTAMANRGIFDKIKGMIIGDFITEDPKEWKRTDDFESIKQVVGERRLPILYAPTFGHRKLENPLLPIGANCRLDTDIYSLELLDQITE